MWSTKVKSLHEVKLVLHIAKSIESYRGFGSWYGVPKPMAYGFSNKKQNITIGLFYVTDLVSSFSAPSGPWCMDQNGT